MGLGFEGAGGLSIGGRGLGLLCRGRCGRWGFGILGFWVGLDGFGWVCGVDFEGFLSGEVLLGCSFWGEGID